MCYVIHMNESCHTHSWVMSHTWMSHVTQMNESCRTHEWVMSHTWMRHVSHTHESSHTYKCVMSQISMHHVTRMNASFHTYEWVMSHVRHVTHRYMMLQWRIANKSRAVTNIIVGVRQMASTLEVVAAFGRYKYKIRLMQRRARQVVLLRVIVCCSVLQCVAVCCSMFPYYSTGLFWYKNKITNLPSQSWLKGKFKKYELDLPSSYRHPDHASPRSFWRR